MDVVSKLNKTEMNEILDWNIDKGQLTDYKIDGWIEDYFITSPNNEYGIVVYNIEEWRMGAESGLIGIYSNSKNPKLVLNSSRTWIWFAYGKTFDFLNESECIVFKKPAYKPNGSKGGFPFVFLNLKKRRFAFYDFDNTSIYYGVKELEKDIAQLFEIHPKELELLNREKRTNEIIDLTELKWFDMTDFDRALEKYYE
ncbi:hypothetical protein [Ochrovirga pacifica]|uniref:hypothetical protein n=1 Tax=Ochrovirga pacifica TaxID=1042376 RepID=UPI0002558E8A|nr:hypothetical protein [Ochrovirga pacifica]